MMTPVTQRSWASPVDLEQLLAVFEPGKQELARIMSIKLFVYMYAKKPILGILGAHKP